MDQIVMRYGNHERQDIVRGRIEKEEIHHTQFCFGNINVTEHFGTQ